MNYRSDIDGLRTIAVVPVVLYHADVPSFGGGFVGVDIFFVISGYLITALILKSLNEGNFSVINFYERRIKRLFPALFCMIAAVFVISYWIMIPSEFSDLSESALAASAFFANIYFWLSAGYFDAPASSMPLLHTWSLAVEEQFYIVFPIILAIMYKFFRAGMRWVVVTLAVISFAQSLHLVRAYPEGAFYLPFGRAWELLLGAILALSVVPRCRSRALNEAVSLIGILLIGYSVVLFNEETQFPGLSAIAPCVGAACILYAGGSGQNIIICRILSLRPMVFCGLISYSLYLWHWPVLVLFKQYNVYPLSLVQTALAVMGSFVLAVISWKYVERPFRFSRMSTARVFATGGGMIAGTTLLSAAVIATNGLPGRLSPERREYAAMTDVEYFFDIYDRGGVFLTIIKVLTIMI